MLPRALFASLGAASLLALAGGPPPDLATIQPNDNRRPAGRLADGVLDLELETTVGRWHPDRPGDPGVVAYAFAEPGRAPEIPGPLVRVPAGTEVRLRLRNTLSDVPVAVHGLDPSGTIDVAPGATREVRFRLDSVGTFFYWGAIGGRRPRPNPRARPPGRPIERDADGTLAGAIVVDSAGTLGAPRDRVLVLSTWDEPDHPSDTTAWPRDLLAINGRSWPHTERLDAAVGDTVRWRVVNTSFRFHPMHLHGFYFRVDRRGNGVRDSAVAGGRGEMAVTSAMPPLSTMALTWVPERSGNWLFHCHIPRHALPHLALDAARVTFADAEAADVPRPGVHLANHALEGMGGLVMGVRVHAARVPMQLAAAAATVPAAAPVVRPIRLLVRVDTGGTAAKPAYRYALDAMRRGPSPPLVLVRGEPVAITVVNRLPEPTAVHWHGIELESYFDGVAGFSGADGRLSPVIAPGDSFVARFTPPRAGTFIYHTHVNERRQMRAGLTGALVVREPGGRSGLDERDRVLLFSSPWLPAAAGVVLVNGDSAPPALELRAGTAYRLRLVNITVDRPAMSVALYAGDSALAVWRPLARDGAELPAEEMIPGPARRPLSIGETFDVELLAATPGELRLEARVVTGERVAVVPVRVR